MDHHEISYKYGVPKAEYKQLLSDEDMTLITGKTKPFTYICIIAVNEKSECLLVYSWPSFPTDGVPFDGYLVGDNVDNKKDVPTEPGIYECKITMHSFRCNRPDDPEEWDMTTVIGCVHKIMQYESSEDEQNKKMQP